MVREGNPVAPPNGRPECSHTPEAPPTYEEALRDRRWDGVTTLYSSSYNTPGYSSGYPGPPPALPSVTSLSRDPEADIRASDALDVSDDDARECLKITLPPMHICIAVICLVLNFILPGSGTILAAFGVFCCTRGNEWTTRKKFGACGVNIGIGLAQLVLTPLLLLGWVWSILWGFAFVGVSTEEYHRKQRRRQGPGRSGELPAYDVPRGPPPRYSSPEPVSGEDDGNRSPDAAPNVVTVNPDIHADPGTRCHNERPSEVNGCHRNEAFVPETNSQPTSTSGINRQHSDSHTQTAALGRTISGEHSVALGSDSDNITAVSS